MSAFGIILVRIFLSPNAGKCGTDTGTFHAVNTEGQKIVMTGECPIFANVELATKPKAPVKVANLPGTTTENI